MMLSGIVGAMVGLVGLPSSALADQVLQHFDQYGYANTPLAPGALRMHSTIEIVKREDPANPPLAVMTIRHHTENSAVLDNGTGCVKINLVKGANTLVSDFTTCTPRNRMRGFQPATIREVYDEDVLPTDLDYDGLGFVYYNSDHIDDESILKQVGQVVQLAEEVVKLLNEIRGGH
jgi:hypothetical protein